MRRRRSMPMILSWAGALAMLSGVGPAAAVTPIGSWGEVGEYAVVDTAAAPQARCLYDTGSEAHVLRSVRSKVFAMYGLRDELQQVGYRLALQRRTTDRWRTIAVGPLRTALVERDVPNGVAASIVSHDPTGHPAGARYRAVLRLLWFGDDGVEGRLRLRVDHHRRTHDDSQGATCRGSVPLDGVLSGARRAS